MMRLRLVLGFVAALVVLVNCWGAEATLVPHNIVLLEAKYPAEYHVNYDELIPLVLTPTTAFRQFNLISENIELILPAQLYTVVSAETVDNIRIVGERKELVITRATWHRHVTPTVSGFKINLAPVFAKGDLVTDITVHVKVAVKHIVAVFMKHPQFTVKGGELVVYLTLSITRLAVGDRIPDRVHIIYTYDAAQLLENASKKGWDITQVRISGAQLVGKTVLIDLAGATVGEITVTMRIKPLPVQVPKPPRWLLSGIFAGNVVLLGLVTFEAMPLLYVRRPKPPKPEKEELIVAEEVKKEERKPAVKKPPAKKKEEELFVEEEKKEKPAPEEKKEKVVREESEVELF